MSFNESLKAYCALLGFHFINNSSVHAGFLCKDGLHLNKAGEELLSDSLYGFVNSIATENETVTASLLTKDDFPELPSVSVSLTFAAKSGSCSYYRNVKDKQNWRFSKYQSVGESNKKQERYDYISKQVIDAASLKKDKKVHRPPLIRNVNKKCYFKVCFI